MGGKGHTAYISDLKFKESKVIWKQKLSGQ